MKILIRGTNFINKGAEAMLLTICEELRRRLPATVFYAEVSASEYEKAREYDIEPVPVPKPEGLISRILFKYRVQQLMAMLPLCIQRLFDHVLVPRLCDTITADLVLDASGYAYHDRTLLLMLTTSAYAQQVDAPYICLPQAWGPFNTRAGKMAVNRILQHARIVYARDRVSFKFLSVGAAANVRMMTDMALAFKAAQKISGTSTNSKMRPMIGVSPNMRVYDRTSGEGAQNGYVKTLVAIIQHCIEKFGCNIRLISNQTFPSGDKMDDRHLCEMIASQVQSEYCSYEARYYGAEEIWNQMKELDLLIGSRFHTLVFALDHAVPVVALGWSHKYAELLESFTLHDCSVRHDELSDSQRLFDVIDRAWEKRAETSEIISRHLPGHQAEVANLFDEIAKIMKENSG